MKSHGGSSRCFSILVKQPGLKWCLAGIAFTWVFLATTDRWDSDILVDEVAAYGSLSNSQDAYPHQCRIRNYDALKRMSIVYTWVNGSLPCYRDMRKTHGGPSAVGGSRDREIGELMYSIRSLEKYMPWHEGTIYIVTPGHVPHWLNLTHPRIQLVHQDDLFPDYAKSFLPTFNTNVLEQFLYRIPGLSDIFMQVNDDYIFTSHVSPYDFFSCDGGIQLLREGNVISHQSPDPSTGIWMASVLNTQQQMDRMWGRAQRHYLKHAPFVYSRRAFERVHQLFRQPLFESLAARFRSRTDMNMPLLHHYYMLAQGHTELGIPVGTPAPAELTGFQLLLLMNNNQDTTARIFDKVLQGTHDSKILALNDEYSDLHVAENVRGFFAKFLPSPTTYERLDAATVAPVVSIYDETGQCNRIDPPVLMPVPDAVGVSAAIRLVLPPSLHATYLRALVQGIGFACGLVLVFCIVQPMRHKVHQQQMQASKTDYVV
ncbi:Aste57867_20787 [Aphanomyces stellatus]|uniref:Aste57867_20787 protein n=1 Tax=Aphanomyces stellatus TaxID=120398 RepID=A0A485LFU1_9STRA|nr:hypothetical protein As57867_020719 [Aphanomyces stellatus]VFT97466.1 Aste57867_20787 [Aphanomyces stellatus]